MKSEREVRKKIDEYIEELVVVRHEREEYCYGVVDALMWVCDISEGEDI